LCVKIQSRHTNQKGNFKYKGEWKPFFQEELDAFLGILIQMGINHDNKISIKDLWSSNHLITIPFYKKVMPRNRFQQILSALRFDDFTTRNTRKEHDRLAAIREINDIMRNNCIKNYIPSESVTIDERMIAFSGKVNFRVYMKSKPDKYGIKVWVLADSNNYYVKDFQVYLGKQKDKREVNQAERVVLDLSTSLEPGVNITVDNFFTSISLANKLFEKNLTLLGTLRKNRKGIPKEMTETKGREFVEYKSFNDDQKGKAMCV